VADSWVAEATHVLLRIAYQSALLPFSQRWQDQPVGTIDLGSPKAGRRLGMSFGFAKTDGFVPIQMEVQSGSRARGDIPARVCLLGRDKSSYKTYALPEDWEVAMAELTVKGPTELRME
jgi:anaphase-promoting complex subunit 4